MNTHDSDVTHELRMPVMMAMSSLEKKPDTAYKMDHGVDMPLDALVSMVNHEQLIVVIMGTSS